jgi:hypothetical protein
VVLAVEAAGVLTQFVPGMAQLALFFTNAVAITLTPFLAQIAFFLADLMDIVT